MCAVQKRGLVGDGEEKEERIGRTREKGSERVEIACLKDNHRIVSKLGLPSFCGSVVNFEDVKFVVELIIL